MLTVISFQDGGCHVGREVIHDTRGLVLPFVQAQGGQAYHLVAHAVVACIFTESIVTIAHTIRAYQGSRIGFPRCLRQTACLTQGERADYCTFPVGEVKPAEAFLLIRILLHFDGEWLTASHNGIGQEYKALLCPYAASFQSGQSLCRQSVIRISAFQENLIFRCDMNFILLHWNLKVLILAGSQYSQDKNILQLKNFHKVLLALFVNQKFQLPYKSVKAR